MRRTSAASCTSSSAEVSPASRGCVPWPEGEPRLVAPHQHVLQPERRAQDAEPRHVEQRLGLGREGPEALAQFIAQPINFAGRPAPAPVAGTGRA